MMHARIKRIRDDTRDGEERKKAHKTVEETIECKCCIVVLLRHAIHKCDRNAPRVRLRMPLQVILWHMELTAVTISASVIGEETV